MTINKNIVKLQNRIDQLKALIHQHKPDIFVVNKLNLRKNDSISIHQFDGYIMEFDNLRSIDCGAWTGILIKENIVYKRRKDLESNGVSTVWLQIKTKDRRRKNYSKQSTDNLPDLELKIPINRPINTEGGK